MVRYKPYAAEFLLLGTTMVVGLLGFWNIYFGQGADPQPHHYLHMATTYIWMGLLLTQLVLLSSGKPGGASSMGPGSAGRGSPPGCVGGPASGP